MIDTVSSTARAFTAPALAIESAALRFGDRVYFAGLDLAVEAGHTACLLGPSGVGKSSLLRLLAGLAPAGATGTVKASDGLPLPGRVALMDQRDHLLPWASLLDNVTLGARLRGEAVDPARARHLLDLVELDAAAALPPRALSGGQRQRVALARTLYENRPVVLMDEPFSALDAVTRHRLQTTTARLLAGRTVLLVTHDPGEALRLGDAVHVLRGEPAQLTTLALPPQPVPRSLGDAAVAAAQAALLALLGAMA
ncbi:ABC transporter ATP-binding protein [Oleomonas cavernae]|uniref:ABC transporter ATP-binding protein n=1 Tax=Oleomonas cavernae TaxID=2320859 RepID=A0A418WIN2_9PROT|nr:ATP-binding cassette domain-containing protein [Oleomonas cavernae]RJF89884.1 ABC transporter ATP-binding protein [Oleomonas cavernae]